MRKVLESIALLYVVLSVFSFLNQHVNHDAMSIISLTLFALLIVGVPFLLLAGSLHAFIRGVHAIWRR